MTQECQDDDNYRVIKDVGRYQISVYRDTVPKGIAITGVIILLAGMVAIVLILAWTMITPINDPNDVTMMFIGMITMLFGIMGVCCTGLVIISQCVPGYSVILMKKTIPPQMPVERISFKKSSSQKDDKKQLQGIVADLEKRATRYNNRCDNLRKESDDLVSGL